MRKTWAATAALAAALGTTMTGAPANAIGEANGHEPFTLTCGGGLGTITISTQKSENLGAAQIIGGGHLIPVQLSFRVDDLTTGKNVFLEVQDKGGGNANRNQATTTCSTTFTGKFADIADPGETLPPGVGANDTLRLTISAKVVVKA